MGKVGSVKSITHQTKAGQDTVLASPEEKLVTAAEVADALSINKRTVALHAERGTLPHYKIGGSLRFRMSDVWASVRRGGAK